MRAGAEPYPSEGIFSRPCGTGSRLLP